jgi:ATP-dependent phosphofructokinase / diphosphate-dependent phosphofructokinase
MKTKIGVLTGGGDCPGLNAVIRAVCKSAAHLGWETLGFRNGFEGLLDIDCQELDYLSMDGLLNRGGTILGTTNKGRFAVKTGIGQVSSIPAEILRHTQANFKKLNLRALVAIGGDGSLTIAQQLFEAGIPVVGIPKTIDNDLSCTAFTFGHDSAITCATDALDRLHTTAESHNRVMVLEVMGRYAGWIAAHAGIAGGGDVILIPEIPFRYEAIVQKIEERESRGKKFTLIVAAEGAREEGKDFVTVHGKEETDKNRETRLGGIGQVVAEEITHRTGKETRVCVLGHLQRGGGPTTFDRLICTLFGAEAVKLVAQEKYGQMVSYQPPEVVSVPISEAIGRLRTIPLDSDIIESGHALGISFGH